MATRVPRRVGPVGHQILELGLAALFVELAIHFQGGARELALAVGTVLIVVVLISDGVLSIARLLSPRSHHALDLLLALAIAVGAIVFRSSVGGAGLAAGLLGAVGLIALERSSDYRRASRRPVRPPISVSDPQVGAAAGVLVRRGARTAGVAAGLARRALHERANRPGARR